MARTRATITCETCHAVVPRWSDTDTLRVRFCSRQCASKRPADRLCSRCHIAPSAKAWGKHCRQCRTDLNEANNHRQAIRSRLRAAYERLAGAACVECCERFIPNHRGHKLFCDPECRRRYHARRQAGIMRENRVLSRKRKATPTTANSIETIGRRDGWVCHICAKKVTRGEATRDHLIPLSDEGTWDPINLAIAHRSCNSKRGAGRLPAQLRLVA